MVVDGQPLGKSDGLFIVPPGVARVILEMDGYQSQTQSVTIPRGTIGRIQVELKPKTGTAPTAAPTPTVKEGAIPSGAIRLGSAADKEGGKLSISGGGHAVSFTRPAAARQLVAIQIFAGRYGTPEPPAEDFQVYVLGKGGEILRDLRFPYAMIERSDLRWYTFTVPAVEVPEKFLIALSFNATQFKGIYVGEETDVKESHSYTGLPGEGFSRVDEPFDWMVRAYVVPPQGSKEKPTTIGKEKP